MVPDRSGCSCVTRSRARSSVSVVRLAVAPASSVAVKAANSAASGPEQWVAFCREPVLATSVIRVCEAVVIRVRCPSVVVMESAQGREGEDLPSDGCASVTVTRLVARDALADSLVRPVTVEVLDPFGQDPTQVFFPQDQNMVQAFSAETSEESLANGIQVRRPRRDGDHLHARTLSGYSEETAELAVVVANQEPRRLLVRRGLSELLGHPRIGWTAGDVDMPDVAARMGDDEERVEWPDPGVGQLQEGRDRNRARAPVGGGFPAPPFRLRCGVTVPPWVTFRAISGFPN